MALETSEEKKFVDLLGRRIRATRIARKETLNDIAVRCGLNKSALSEIENGKRDIRISTLFRIATALRVPPETLLSEHEAAQQCDGGDTDQGYLFGDLL